MIIRAFKADDLNDVMDIWLNTNIKAHSFINENYWISNYELVRSQYIPNSTTYVHEDEGKVNGFLSIMDESFIGAIFIDSEYQSRGIGRVLINYAKEKYDKLSLAVYEENKRALEFYKREGFKVTLLQVDEATGRKELIMEWKR